MTAGTPQVHDNLSCLQQLLQLTQTLTAKQYTLAFANQTIGQHVRHIIDHYSCLWRALENSEDIDYENRPRDLRLEQCPLTASAKLKALCTELEALNHLDQQTQEQRLAIAFEEAGTRAPSRDTTGLVRELAFLASHTVHHLAIIKLLAASQQKALPTEFGVHASTLKYWASQEKAS